jgi:hypothetical protein
MKVATQTFGTGEEGFAVGADENAGTIHVRMWGFWTAETADHFAGIVIAACVSAHVSIVTIDAADLKPLRDVGQDAVGAVLAAVPAHNVRRVLVTRAGALTRLQLLRIAKERAVPGLVEFVA